MMKVLIDGLRVLVRLLAFNLVWWLLLLPLYGAAWLVGELPLSEGVGTVVMLVFFVVYGPLSLPWAWKATMPALDEGSGFSRTWVGGSDGAAGEMRRRIARGRAKWEARRKEGAEEEGE